MLLHLRTNVGAWRCAGLAALDEVLRAAGSRPVDLPWADFELDADGVHFTSAGAAAFAAALVAALAAALAEGGGGGLSSVHVVADSLIDHNDRGADGAWHGAASAALVEALAARGVRATVDAVCGSGFVARARHGEHFHARVARALRAVDAPRALLLAGGWNDEGAELAAAACARMAQRRLALA